MCMSSYPSIICWRGCLCSIVLPLLLYQRSIGCIYGCPFLGSLFCSIVYLSVLSPIPHYLDYHSFVVSLEVNSPLLGLPNLVSWEFYVPSYTGHCLRARPCLLSGSSPEDPESQWLNSSLSTIICLEGMTPLSLDHHLCQPASQLQFLFLALVKDLRMETEMDKPIPKCMLARQPGLRTRTNGDCRLCHVLAGCIIACG